MMKLVITGALGFVGQNFARYLRSQGRPVSIIGIDWFEGAPESDLSPFDHLHIGCFASAAALDLCRNADAVVHLAAQASVQQSLADPRGTFENNTAKSQRLIDWLRCSSPDTHLVFASTGAVSQDEGAISEQATANPASPYGASKLATEALMRAYAASWGLSGVALRFSNVYGPHSRRQGGVIPQYCRALQREGRLKVNGDGRQTRDYIHVEDISRAIARTIETRAEGLFQLGTGVPTSLLEVIEIFRTLQPERAPEVVYGAALAGEIRHNCADISKAKELLGFAPQRELRAGIEQTFRWYNSELVV